MKIAQDMVIEKGQVISDRIPERTRLQAQEKQLQLSLLRIHAADDSTTTQTITRSRRRSFATSQVA